MPCICSARDLRLGRDRLDQFHDLAYRRRGGDHHHHCVRLLVGTILDHYGLLGATVNH
ncbi:MAG: hypothetical protein U0X92_12560 [Anaerolineales bacterium]